MRIAQRHPVRSCAKIFTPQACSQAMLGNGDKSGSGSSAEAAHPELLPFLASYLATALNNDDSLSQPTDSQQGQSSSQDTGSHLRQDQSNVGVEAVRSTGTEGTVSLQEILGKEAVQDAAALVRQVEHNVKQQHNGSSDVAQVPQETVKEPASYVQQPFMPFMSNAAGSPRYLHLQAALGSLQLHAGDASNRTSPSPTKQGSGGSSMLVTTEHGSQPGTPHPSEGSPIAKPQGLSQDWQLQAGAGRQEERANQDLHNAARSVAERAASSVLDMEHADHGGKAPNPGNAGDFSGSSGSGSKDSSMGGSTSHAADARSPTSMQMNAGHTELQAARFPWVSSMGPNVRMPVGRQLHMPPAPLAMAAPDAAAAAAVAAAAVGASPPATQSDVNNAALLNLLQQQPKLLNLWLAAENEQRNPPPGQAAAAGSSMAPDAADQQQYQQDIPLLPHLGLQQPYLLRQQQLIQLLLQQHQQQQQQEQQQQQQQQLLAMALNTQQLYQQHLLLQQQQQQQQQRFGQSQLSFAAARSWSVPLDLQLADIGSGSGSSGPPTPAAPVPSAAAMTALSPLQLSHFLQSFQRPASADDAMINTRSMEFTRSLHPEAPRQFSQFERFERLANLSRLGELVNMNAAQGASDPQRVGKSWDDLSPNVRSKVISIAEECLPYIKLHHFDAGVRHWLVQLTALFGEDAALSGLNSIRSATNLEGVRNMKAFITTRLIDHYEQLIWAQDPEGYAQRRLLPKQYSMVQELIQGPQGLQWHHFDPKVLETIRDMNNVDYTRTRLQRLSARELASVQNVPAYLYTLLSKRGKTARQAAAAKAASEISLQLACMSNMAAAPQLPVPNPGLQFPVGGMSPLASTLQQSHVGQLQPTTSLAQLGGSRIGPSLHPSY